MPFLVSGTFRADTYGVNEARPALPVHYELTRWQVVFACSAIAASFSLLVWLGCRIVAQIDLRHWWVPLAAAAGLAAADFGSGMIHWAADTWGRDDCPLIGPRLLVPFRVHHINPDDLLRRRFIDANGEVAAVTVPVLLMLIAMPIEHTWGGVVAVFGLALCGLGSLTNQIHQWSHMPSPPAPVRVMQACGLLLGRDEHAAHHNRPYDRHYCITTGWCNRPLEAIGFFRRLESAITSLTGLTPRHDDRRYETRFGAAVAETESRIA